MWNTAQQNRVTHKDPLKVPLIKRALWSAQPKGHHVKSLTALKLNTDTYKRSFLQQFIHLLHMGWFAQCGRRETWVMKK